jgi:hypothetical protein
MLTERPPYPHKWPGDMTNEEWDEWSPRWNAYMERISPRAKLRPVSRAGW